jgi:hypothetical protein
LRRCGLPVFAVAARSRATTWPLSRTIMPRPSAATACRATVMPEAVTMSR